MKPSVWLTLLVPIGPTTQTCAVITINFFIHFSYNINSAVLSLSLAFAPPQVLEQPPQSCQSESSPETLDRWSTVRCRRCKGNKQICRSRSRAKMPKMQKETDRIKKNTEKPRWQGTVNGTNRLVTNLGRCEVHGSHGNATKHR